MIRDLRVDYNLITRKYDLTTVKRFFKEIASSLAYKELVAEIATLFMDNEGSESQYKLVISQRAKLKMRNSQIGLLENIVELENQALKRLRGTSKI